MADGKKSWRDEKESPAFFFPLLRPFFLFCPASQTMETFSVSFSPFLLDRWKREREREREKERERERVRGKYASLSLSFLEKVFLGRARKRISLHRFLSFLLCTQRISERRTRERNPLFSVSLPSHEVCVGRKANDPKQKQPVSVSVLVLRK